MGRHYARMLDAALDQTGRKYRSAIMTFEMIKSVGPYLLAVAALGGLGVGGYLMWTRWLVPAFESTPDAAGQAGSAAADVPTWVWVTAAVLAALAARLYWTRRLALNPAARTIQIACAVIALAGVIGFGLSGIIG